MGQLFIGSVAQKVVTDASCSVRVIRATAEEADSPVRLVIGADGSRDCEEVVNTVSKRLWKAGSAVHLIIVVDCALSTASISSSSVLGKWVKQGDKTQRAWIDRMVENFENKLTRAGLVVSSLVKEGNPKKVILEEAGKWGSDCIFVGARGLNMIERFLIGSVSTVVAARAHCSVEVIRRVRYDK